MYCCDELADWCGGCACATRRRPVGLRPSLGRFSSPDCGVCASCSTLCSLYQVPVRTSRPAPVLMVCHVIRRFICATPRVPRRTNWKDQHRPAAVPLFLSSLKGIGNRRHIIGHGAEITGRTAHLLSVSEMALVRWLVVCVRLGVIWFQMLNFSPYHIKENINI